jgi:hypothetical protein
MVDMAGELYRTGGQILHGFSRPGRRGYAFPPELALSESKKPYPHPPLGGILP